MKLRLTTALLIILATADFARADVPAPVLPEADTVAGTVVRVGMIVAGVAASLGIVVGGVFLARRRGRPGEIEE